MREQNVEICKGPNCKAWSSDKIARELREIREVLDLEQIKVCRVPCMNACGGGVSVRVSVKAKFVKMKEVKEVDEVLDVLGIRDAVITC